MTTSDIPRASFVTEILTTAGQFEKEDINAKLGKLSKKIEEVKVEVYDALQKKYDEFYPNLNTAVGLHARVESLASEMDQVGDKIENEIKSQLQVSTSEFQDLSTQFKESSNILVILEKLSKIHHHLQCIDKSLKNQEYVAATKSLNEIQSLLETPENENESEIKILKKLQENFNKQKEKLECEVDSAWSNSVKWILPNASDANDVVVELCIQQSSKAIDVLKDITQAMADLDLLNKKLSIFSKRIFVYCIKPIVIQSDLQFTDEAKGDEKKIRIRYSNKSVSKGPLHPDDVFKKLANLFRYLEQTLSFEIQLPGVDNENNDNDSTNKKLLIGELGLILSSDVFEFIIAECLKHSIPVNNKQLEAYNEIINETQKFQSELVRVKFINETETTLTDFVKNVNVLFANKKCQEILNQARDVMRCHIHNTIEVNEDHPFGTLPGLDLGVSGIKKSKTSEVLPIATDAQLCAKVLKLPKCHVSISAQSLVELAYKTLHEATQSSSPCAIQLFYAVRNVFELYCNIVPTYHKEQLETIPQQSALHHNNCMFIAHHLLTLGHQYQQKLPEPLNQGAATFLDLVPMLRRLGTDCFLKQMAKQKDQLLETLKQTKGMAGLAEGENGHVAERAVKQVMYQLQQLGNVWQPVLPNNIYCKSIGTLINAVMVEILTNVTRLEDISADDTTQLHAVMLIVVNRAPDMFKDCSDGDEPAELLLQKHVRKWLKYKELLILLNAGLQEISDRWADGKGPLALEFSSNEVKQLIRALFQNTDRRAAVLSKIK